MASSNGPDLTAAREALEALMDDACTAAFSSRRDLVLDESTGKLVDPSEPEILYGPATTGDGGRSLADDEGLGGKCKASKASQSEAVRYAEEGTANSGVDVYKFSTPWDAPVLPIGTVVTVTSSRRDPDLVDKELEIKMPAFGTFLVQRSYLTTLRVAVPA